MLWRWIWWWFIRPKYEIVVGTSHTTAVDAAAQAQVKVNASGGEAIGIAADAICCETAEQGGLLEWDVYVLIKQ